MHNYLSLIPSLRWQDALDVVIVAYVIYRIALLIRGTRTVQMVVGLFVIGIAFVASQMLGLFTLSWLLNNFLGSLIVILVVLFQADIRRALTRMGAGPFFGARTHAANVTAEELTGASTWLSARRIGALIVVEQEVGLTEFVETGRVIDAQVSRELIQTIFMRGSPLHDGAVIVKGDRVVAAACLLPLSANPNVSLTLGTRHRAAIGLTEENDAIVVVVSEENGTISIASRGRLTQEIEPDKLLARLQRLPA
ncbi:MAG: diadenylate cyclase CdaA [Candidatus Binataceae bacterium]